MTYCQAVRQMDSNNPNVHYHNHEYGFPLHDDDELFGRLILEINQAGLSWTTILKKKDNFRSAYSNFNIDQIANYGEGDWNRLLNDAGIIRNRLKVNAAIYNAQQILSIQNNYGSFKNWLDHHHPLSKPEWVKVFKKHFKFVGGEIVNEFLMSTGYLPGAHEPSCPVYAKLQALK
ncbi:MAG: DNA-3-methyladenine glycosylase I [Tunicatimonas sp.]|uniref:DNA-3-methyladenine glycosylase I n=1 Tax=Tunicatimonas sp. TaxID=1940096 RepID=UPI003C75D8AA